MSEEMNEEVMEGTKEGQATGWTFARVEQLRGLIAEGKSAGQAARELGVTRNAVIGKALRCKLGAFHSQPPSRPAVLRMADRLAAVSLAVVDGPPDLRRRTGQKAPAKPITQAQRHSVMADLRAGIMIQAEIARRHGLTLSQVRKVAEFSGLGKAAPEQTRRDRKLLAAIKDAPFKERCHVSANVGLARFAEGFEGQHGRVAIEDLQSHHCRFPIDQPEGGVFFCGLPKTSVAYCAEHDARCNSGFPHRRR